MSFREVVYITFWGETRFVKVFYKSLLQKSGSKLRLSASVRTFVKVSSKGLLGGCSELDEKDF